ncbi:RNA polymerase sigma factor [Plantactinospora sp. B5E13]|uniref:RNA polymerase sigma factor n=1 Tax=unclassified Plantactinospora TaxID=2631981 RepID=UPI00325D837D
MRGDGGKAAVRVDTRLGDRGEVDLDASFEEFCQQNFVLVERFLLHQCPDPGVVEDAVLEAFVAARAEWHEIRGYRKPLAWVVQTARHRLLIVRRRGAAEPGETVEPGGPGTPPAGASDEPPDGSAAVAREVLRGWLRQLPPRQAEVLALALDGWSDHEIARVLGVAYRTARGYRRQARRRLREVAERTGHAEGDGRS